MRWPYQKRIEPAHAWGVVAIGTAGLVAIPTILATLNATDSHFRWWWPTNWMAVPLVLFLLGVGLAAVPVRPIERSERDAVRGPVNVVTDLQTGEQAQPHAPVPAARRRRVTEKSPPVVAKSGGRAFLCHVREDSARADRLQESFEAAGIPVWRATADVRPGDDWRRKIRQAITENALVFIACFSVQSVARTKSQQNEELTLAIDQLRRRRPDVPWLIPVRFDDCEVPDLDISPGKTLRSLQPVDLFGRHRNAEVMRLVSSVRELLGLDLADQEETGHG